MTTPAPSGQSQNNVMTDADTGNGVQPATQAPPSDETTTYTYDLAGNLIEAIAPPTSSGGPNDDTLDTYDAGGELATVTTGYGTTAVSTTSSCYDPNGDTTAVVAPDGNAAESPPVIRLRLGLKCHLVPDPGRLPDDIELRLCW